MCKLGDIIVVKEYVAENNKKIGTHSFIVVDDNNGTIKGLSYDMVTTVISSFKSKSQKLKKLSFKENKEITNNDISGSKKLKNESYVKVDKLFYFNKDKLDYYVFGRISDDFLDELLQLILQLSDEEKLTIVSNNLI